MFALPLLWKVIGAALAILALYGAGFYMGHHVESLAFDAYKLKVEKASTDARAAAQAHNSEVLEAARVAQATTVAKYEEQIHEADSARSSAAAANVADSVRGVFVGVTDCYRDASTQVAASPGHPHAPSASRARLQPAVALAILNVGTNANDAVKRRDAQIAGLQARVRQDLIQINGAYSEEGSE